MKCTQNQQQQGRKRSIASFINTHTHTVRKPLTGITPATELFVYLMYIYYCPIVLFLFLKSATVSSKSQQKNVVQTNHNNTTKWKVFCDLMHPQCHEIHGCVKVVKKFNRGFSSDSNPHTMNIYNHLSAECWVLVCVEWVWATPAQLPFCCRASCLLVSISCRVAARFRGRLPVLLATSRGLCGVTGGTHDIRSEHRSMWGWNNYPDLRGKM